MTKYKLFNLLSLAIAFILCYEANLFAQNSEAVKKVRSFYSWYLKDNTHKPEKLKKFFSSKLYQEIQQMEDSKFDELFTKKSENASLKEYTRFELDSENFNKKEGQAGLYVHLFYQNAHSARMTVNLIVEEGIWKINEVLGITQEEVMQKAVEGNVETSELQKNLIKLQKPIYPQTAKAVRVFGDVKIKIAIDESGKVISANVISGHPLLREASRNAALESTFSMNIKDGKPVKSVGVIIYTFKEYEILYFTRTC